MNGIFIKKEAQPTTGFAGHPIWRRSKSKQKPAAIFLCVLCVLCGSFLFTGCTMVGCNHVFPKPAWYWSKEARDCRADQKHE
jgi:hypothetical protein